MDFGPVDAGGEVWSDDGSACSSPPPDTPGDADVERRRRKWRRLPTQSEICERLRIRENLRRELDTLRRSTANGQIQLLPFDVLMVVLSHAGFREAFWISRVSRALRTTAQSLLYRLPVIAELAFLPRYLWWSPVLDELKMEELDSYMRVMLEERREKTRVTKWMWSTFTVATYSHINDISTAGEFVELATRSAPHVAQFKGLR